MTCMTTYTGSCHCGAVRFSVEGDFSKAISCNCSHCHAKGLLLAFVPREQFSLTHGEDQLTEYRFNQMRIEHRFCKICGVQPFGYGTGSEGAEMAAVNLRCVEGLDTDTLEVSQVDGKSF